MERRLTGYRPLLVRVCVLLYDCTTHDQKVRPRVLLLSFMGLRGVWVFARVRRSYTNPYVRSHASVRCRDLMIYFRFIWPP